MNKKLLMDVLELRALPIISDPRGSLCFIEEDNQIPFRILRTYWMYDFPTGGKSIGLALKQSEEFIIALSGSFDVVLNDGSNEFRFYLHRPNFGLHIPKLTWRTIENVSTNSVVLIACSGPDSSVHCVRDFNVYKKIKDVL